MNVRNIVERRYSFELPTGKVVKDQNGREIPEKKFVTLSTSSDVRADKDPLKVKGFPAIEYPLTKGELEAFKASPGLMALVNTHHHLQLVA